MKNILLTAVAAAGLLASCSSTRDERMQSSVGGAPVAHNTIVDCPVYDGMTKTSLVLAQTTSGDEVQVVDTISAYFVRVRIDKDGKNVIGYMDRRCFGEQGSK